MMSREDAITSICEDILDDPSWTLRVVVAAVVAEHDAHRGEHATALAVLDAALDGNRLHELHQNR